jgi:peptidoglycan/xylan/chitin deacetylase (PgdA/CDA1 family)
MSDRATPLGRLARGVYAVLCRALYHTGALRWFFRRRFHGAWGAALCLHGVSRGPAPLCIRADRFAACLALLRRWGALSDMDAAAAWLDGPTPVNRPHFALTFDDAYANVYEVGEPVLRQAGARATVYVVPDYAAGAWPWWFVVGAANEVCASRGVSCPAFDLVGWLPAAAAGLPWPLLDRAVERMAPEDLPAWVRRLAEETGTTVESVAALYPDGRPAGWEQIAASTDVLQPGCHTRSHAILAWCRDRDAAAASLAEARAEVARRAGGPCDHFAYPRGRPGDHSDWTEKTLAACGFRTAVTTEPGLIKADTPRLRIPRLFVADPAPAELAAQLAGFAEMWQNGLASLKHWMKRGG